MMDMKRTLILALTGKVPDDVAAKTAQLAICILKRSLDWLVTADNILGLDKVAAFRQLLLRPKFWAAAFTSCADIACWSYCKEVPPFEQLQGSLWMCLGYEVWHMTR